MTTPTLNNTKPKTLRLHEGKNPYYIVTPPYQRASAGITVLHRLCHTLNIAGKEAYLIIDTKNPWQQRRKKLCDMTLNTPLLTNHIIKKHKKKNLTPIVIYPEKIMGTPRGGSCIVRYVLNFPGLLGGDTEYTNNELCFSYSKVLAQETRSPENILFMPVSEMEIFHPPENEERTITSFYAEKYQGPLFDLPENAVRITKKTAKKEMVDILQRSTFFYAYENTALASEAILCGCPVVLLSTPQLTDSIARYELGQDGCAIGTNPAAMQKAMQTVTKAIDNYKNCYFFYWKQLENFVSETQVHSKKFQNDGNFIIKGSFLYRFLSFKNKCEKFYRKLLKE